MPFLGQKSWYSYEDTDGKLWLRQTLKINNVDISTWKTAMIWWVTGWESGTALL